jgi:mannosyltransferase OCH1-like enzyme
MRLDANARHGIPQLVWQTSASADLPPPAMRARESWQKLNPGWKLKLHDDSQAERFFRHRFESNWSAVYAAFKQYPIGVMRADLWRYAAVWAYGGVYADIDVKCVRPASAWLQRDCEVVLAPENDHHICQWTFASVPQHKFFSLVLELAATRAREGITVLPPAGQAGEVALCAPLYWPRTHHRRARTFSAAGSLAGCRLAVSQDRCPLA